MSTGKVIGICAGVVLIIAGSVYFFHFKQFEDAKAALKASDLKDPSSVQFRNLRVVRGGICGEYNAKNTFGAYVGFEDIHWNKGSDSASTHPEITKIMCDSDAP